MWNLSKHRRNSRLSRAQLESLVLQRTAALQNLSLRLLKALGRGETEGGA